MHAVRHFRLCLVNDHQRQLDADGRAVAHARAHRLDPSAVRLDEVTADRQAEAEPAVRAGERAVGLAEALEQMRQESGAMPSPVSLTVISTCESTRSQPDLHAAAARRELDGVREQVPHDLLQPLRVARHGHARAIDGRLEPDALGGGRRRDGLERVLDHRVESRPAGRRGAACR